MTNIAIDLGKHNSQVAIRSDNGTVIQRRIRTDRATLAMFFSAYGGSKVIIESSTSTPWIAELLEELKLKVVVVDPRSIAYEALGRANKKTDKRDAEALLISLEKNIYRKAHRLSKNARELRRLASARQSLIRQRTAIINEVRAALEENGIRIKGLTIDSFAKMIRAHLSPGELGSMSVDVLLDHLATLEKNISVLDDRSICAINASTDLARLMRIPGVGPVTTIYFAAVIDDPHRFHSAKHLASYLGLVPKEHSSGERRSLGKITKTGNAKLRALLVQIAHCVKGSKDARLTPLQDWYCTLAARRGKHRATVALARRFAGIIWACWRDKLDLDPEKLLPKPIETSPQ